MLWKEDREKQNQEEVTLGSESKVVMSQYITPQVKRNNGTLHMVMILIAIAGYVPKSKVRIVTGKR